MCEMQEIVVALLGRTSTYPQRSVPSGLPVVTEAAELARSSARQRRSESRARRGRPCLSISKWEWRVASGL